MQTLEVLIQNNLPDYPPLGEERTNELARCAQSGDMTARDTLILHNIALVKSTIRRFFNMPPSEDLVDEGIIGLIHAIGKYDPDMGYKFSTYATNWIRQSIHRSFFKQTHLYFPSHVHESLFRIKKATRNQQQSAEQVSKQAKVALKDVQALLPLVDAIYISMDALDADGNSLSNVLTDEQDDYAEVDDLLASRQRVEELLAILTPREREIVTRYYGLGGTNPMTYKEIGLRIGLTPRSINTYHFNAMKKLRAHANNQTMVSEGRSA